VPSGISLPAQVTITGSADDDLVVNGSKINGNNTAGPVNHTFTLSVSSFTIGGYNNRGSANYNYHICFSNP
jgi:hypothetical protein